MVMLKKTEVPRCTNIFNIAGIQTTPDARFYQITSKFTPFSSKGKNLIVQYSVKHEQNIDCGGGYIKLLPADTNQENFGGDSQYL